MMTRKCYYAALDSDMVHARAIAAYGACCAPECASACEAMRATRFDDYAVSAAAATISRVRVDISRLILRRYAIRLLRFAY